MYNIFYALTYVWCQSTNEIILTALPVFFNGIYFSIWNENCKICKESFAKLSAAQLYTKYKIKRKKCKN